MKKKIFIPIIIVAVLIIMKAVIGCYYITEHEKSSPWRTVSEQSPTCGLWVSYMYYYGDTPPENITVISKYNDHVETGLTAQEQKKDMRDIPILLKIGDILNMVPKPDAVYLYSDLASYYVSPEITGDDEQATIYLDNTDD